MRNRMSRVDKSMITTFILLTLPILLSCSKPGGPLGKGKNEQVSTQVTESIRRDLGMLDGQTLEVLDYEAIPPRGGWNGRENATVLKSTGGKFQIARVFREPESTHSQRWAVYNIDIQLIDGTGEVIIFQREFDHRPTTEDIKAFKRWLEEW